MNHRILFCLVLILGNILAASADCNEANAGDVEYDCANDVADDGHKDESEEKIDDVVDPYPEYTEEELNDDPPESSSTTSTSTTVAPVIEEDYDHEYDDQETQQDETHENDMEAIDQTGIQNDTDEDLTTKTSIPKTVTEKQDDEHADLFYDAIKATLTSENYTNAYRYVKHPERVECMITEMRKSKVMDKINKESYVFSQNIEHGVKFEFRNVTTFMYDLEREIQDANFDCTEMGNTRIYILVFVAVLAVILLVLYIRRR